MQTSVREHKRNESVTVGEQRLYERVQDKRQFRVTEYDGGALPELDAFKLFDVYDFSRDGFSYWSQNPPQSDRLLVGLVYRKRPHFHEAQVMHFTTVERDGENWQLVGCKFARRIEYSEAQSVIAQTTDEAPPKL